MSSSELPLRKIVQGDCLKTMKQFPDESIDLIVTDPPYGLSFMGKDWDKAVPSVEIWRECLRVLKPGGFAFIMSSPRLDCLGEMSRRLQEAGFETGFSPMFHTFASGFPKSMNVAKNIKKGIANDYAKVIWTQLNNSDNAIFAEALSQKNLIDVGALTKEKDFVVENAARLLGTEKSNVNVSIAKKSLEEVHHIRETNICIVPVNVDHSQKQGLNTVLTVGKNSEDPTHNSNKIVFIFAQNLMPTSLCERIRGKIKEEEVQKISLGKSQFSEETAFIVSCVKVIENWRHTTLSQLKRDLIYDMTSQTEKHSAINVIITKSIMARLILSMDDILRKLHSEIDPLDGSYGGAQFKPAVEVIIVAMKPLSEKSFVDQALKRVAQENEALSEIEHQLKVKYGLECVEWE